MDSPDVGSFENLLVAKLCTGLLVIDTSALVITGLFKTSLEMERGSLVLDSIFITFLLLPEVICFNFGSSS